MRYGLVCAGALVISACSARYAVPASTQTSAGPDESFECVRKQLTSLGYRQTSLDIAERRVSAAKIDPKARRPDIQFRRMLDKLEIEIGAQADGQTNIEVQAHTFAEYATQRGPTEVEEKASPRVKADSQELLERCRG